jgi:curved DNA-binding protein CbpA
MNLETLRKELDEIESRLANGSYYDVLGVAPSADEAAIKRAFIEKAKRFHVDAYAGRDLGDLKPRLMRAFAEMSRINGVLSDARQRADYNARIALQARGVPTDVRQIFQAEEALKAGRRMLEHGRFDAALEKLRESVRLNPSAADARASLAWAEYCDSVGADGARVGTVSSAAFVSELEKVVAEFPKNEAANLYLGHIARNENRVKAALSRYEAVLDLNPSNAEAQSGIRFLKMRQQKAHDEENSLFGTIARLLGMKR